MIGEGILFVAVFVSGAVFARIVLRAVVRLRILDHPNERSSHRHPTPRGGGVGIVGAALAGMGASAWLCAADAPDLRAALLVAGATVLLAGVGAWDDLRDARPATKLVVQLVAAVLALLAVGPVRQVGVPGIGVVALGALSWPLCVAWLIGFSNVYNFMDGVDGIAGVFAGVSALTLFGASVFAGGGGVAWIALPVSAACLSFLTVNWEPARVFMGDSGSLPVGMLLALTALIGRHTGRVPFPVACLALGPFLYDGAFTVCRRALRGENLLTAHRSHLYQRLVISGWRHGQVALLYGGWTVLTGGLGFMYLSGGVAVRAGAVVAGILSGVGLSAYVMRREGARRSSKGGGDSPPPFVGS